MKNTHELIFLQNVYMTTRRIYKSLERGLDRGASEPEGEQSLRVARKLAVALEPKRSLDEIITESGEYTHLSKAAPKAADSPPKARAKDSNKSQRWPTSLPFKCEYMKRDFRKATALADAHARLKSDHVIQNHENARNRWVFVRHYSEDGLRQIRAHYSKSSSKMVGEDKDIALWSYHN